MNIGIHSDLHTECSLCTISNLSELDVLILAGDIGDPATVRLFFDYLRRKTTKLPVLYVLGNHEYYGFAISEAKDIYRSISQEYGITLLDDESITLNGIQFSGTTLWSDFSRRINRQTPCVGRTKSCRISAKSMMTTASR